MKRVLSSLSTLTRGGWLALLLGGCQTAPPPETAAPPWPHPLLAVHFQPQGRPTFSLGTVTPSEFEIQNISDRAVVVLSIQALSTPGEAAVTLFGPAAGSLIRQEPTDRYEYDPLPQSATRLPFYAGLLLPAQRLSVTCSYRPVTTTETFVVRYVAAVLPYTGAADSLQPLRVYLPGPEPPPTGRPAVRHYRPYTENLWREIYTLSAVPGQGYVSRQVLIPDLPEPPAEQRCQMPIWLEPGGFRLEAAQQAVARIAGPGGRDWPLTYSMALGGYVVADRDGYWLLSDPAADRRGLLLPTFPLSMLRDIDTQGSIQVRISEQQAPFEAGRQPTGGKFWGEYPVYNGDGIYTQGEFVRIDDSSLLLFLRQVRDKSGQLKKYQYFANARFYVLVISDDTPAEQARGQPSK